MDKPKPNPRKPQFFKATLSTSDQQLSIPVSFMSYLKGEQSSSGEAVLRSNKLDRSWPVKVEGRRFQHGWKEFARDHQLSVGDCLVFRHRGRMVFDVMVFDSSMREYPPSDVLNHGGGTRKKRKKYSGEKMETIATSASNPTLLLHGVEQVQFAVQLQAYNLRKPGRYMIIPKKFARDNGLVEGMITLKDKYGGSWQANLKHKKCNGQIYIGSGWAEFSEANTLNLGDICTFKLVGGEKVVMEVTTSHSYGSQKKESGKRAVPETSTSSNYTPLVGNVVKAPYFTRKIRHSNSFRAYMNIPSQFARINGLMERFCVITLKDENGRSWQVNLKHKKTYDLAYIGGGWREFMDDNRLEMGDVCTFKLVSGGENVVMEVSISRSYGSQHLLTDSSSECERVEPPLVDKESIRKSCRKE